MKQKHKFKQAKFLNSKITAAVSITLVLFLLGLVLLFSLIANNLSDNIKETISFNIVLRDSANDEEILRIKKFLERASFAKSIDYVSKEEALKALKEELGEDADNFIDLMPLPVLFRVHLKTDYANSDSLAVTESKIRGYSSDIEEIEYKKDLIQTVNEHLKTVEVAIFGLATLLLIISFALINNTIRLMVHSKRFLIHTMKLVGAKSGFIRKPFILSNLLSGIVAALAAMGILTGLLYYAPLPFNFWSLIEWQDWLIVFGCVLCLGIIISFLATYIAVNKYIRIDYDNLYYI